MSQSSPVKLLYIAGETRSGSTLLDRVLGQTPGFFSVGELAWLWNEGLGAAPTRPPVMVDVRGHSLSNQGRCGCTAALRECPVWQSVFTHAFGSPDRLDPAAMFQQQLANRPRPRLRRRVAAWRRAAPAPNCYPEGMARLYQALQHVTGCRVIVESSKDAAHLDTLARLPALGLHVLHLVRDPRAVAYSDLRRQLRHRYSPRANAARWTKHNLAVEAVCAWHRLPRLVLRYEDFTLTPQPALQRLLDFAGSPAPLSRFTTSHDVNLAVNHTVYGNPNRFATGPVRIRADAEWRTHLPRRHQLAITLLTWPILRRYHYPFRVPPAA